MGTSKSSESEESEEEEELDDNGNPKLKQPKAKSGSWWAEPKYGFLWLTSSPLTD